MDYGTGVHDYKLFLRELEWLFSRRIIKIILPLLIGSRKTLKELSEALSVFMLLYNDSVTRTRKTVVVEACASTRGRVAVLVSAFIHNAVAVSTDRRRASSELREFAEKWWDGRKLLLRHGVDMFSEEFDRVLEEAKKYGEYRVLVGVHCCKMLSVRLIDAFSDHNYDKLILVPCCADPDWTEKTLGLEIHGYLDWVYALKHYAETRRKLETRVQILADMLSDANAAIIASPRKQTNHSPSQ